MDIKEIKKSNDLDALGAELRRNTAELRILAEQEERLEKEFSHASDISLKVRGEIFTLELAGEDASKLRTNFDALCEQLDAIEAEQDINIAALRANTETRYAIYRRTLLLEKRAAAATTK